MPVNWREPGEAMGTIDLSQVSGDQIVIHYGGPLASVDAYTFANSLVAFADAARSVSQLLDPGQSIEIRLEALGPGSFRAILKKIHKGLGGFFSRGIENVLWAVVATLIYEKLLSNDTTVAINVNDREVIISRGDDRIIVPRSVYEHSRSAQKDFEISRKLSQAFDVLQSDPAVENFGLTPRLADTTPLVQIPRSDFPRLAALPEIISEDARRRARIAERVRLIILKLWLRPGKHKWSFEWNGVPISARISDDMFLQKLFSREVLLGAGDALDVELHFEQVFEPHLGVYQNDFNTFNVQKVLGVVTKGDESSLLD
ncbi:MAG: hypothetical protein U1E56_13410 [Bauldia sp.]